MPLASAPKAPWVEVWLSPHTIVMPGSVKPCSGPMMWTMPWRWSSSLKYSMPKSAAFLASAATCTADSGFLMPCVRSVVGTLWSTTASVRCGERTLRPRAAQALERLRARHLVDEVAVDVDERGAVGLLRDDVVVPDLVVERLRSGHGSDSWVPWLRGAPAGSARPRAAGGRRQGRRPQPHGEAVDRHAARQEPPRHARPIGDRRVVERPAQAPLPRRREKGRNRRTHGRLDSNRHRA